ncbi:hypothetical protein PtB15_4B588 [Puccinia triticina]|nr:hypothetical protein PtB15_4B588 [Puccinia triticina]
MSQESMDTDRLESSKTILKLAFNVPLRACIHLHLPAPAPAAAALLLPTLPSSDAWRAQINRSLPSNDKHPWPTGQVKPTNLILSGFSRLIKASLDGLGTTYQG